MAAWIQQLQVPKDAQEEKKAAAPVIQNAAAQQQVWYTQLRAEVPSPGAALDPKGAWLGPAIANAPYQ
jgi:hypothetical protein